MKTKAILTVILILSAASGARSLGQQAPSRPPWVLVLVIDTSSSCGRYLGDFRTLARQAAAALRPGDYLEIIAARPGSPTLKLAHTLRTANPEELKPLEAGLAGLRTGFLTDADVAAALEMARARLTETCSQKTVAGVTTIVLSDGRLRSDDVARLLATANRFTTNGWSLFVTGTRQANRELLVAAHKGSFTWSLITEANPALWLERQAAAPVSPVADGQRATAIGPVRSDRTSKELPAARGEPKDPATGERRTQTAKEQGYSITTRIDAVTSVGPLSELPADKRTELPAPAVTEPNQPTEAAAVAGAVVAPPAVVPPRRPTGPKQPPWARLRGAIRRYWWLIPAAAVFAALAFMISRSVAEARRWDAKRQGHLAKGPANDPGRLVVRYGEQSYQLGPLKQFRAAHIGPGSKNTIRTPDSTPGERHVRLYRRGDSIMLQNLAPAPILVNSLEVKPGGRRRLVTPSVIQLNNRTKLNLELVRPNAAPAQKERSSEHERQPQPQPVG